MRERLKQSLSTAKTLKKQLANAKLLPESEFEKSLLDLETFFDNALFGLGNFIRSKNNTGLNEVRKSTFLDSSEKLQNLGINWLFEHGADFVINKISHVEYFSDVMEFLKKKM